MQVVRTFMTAELVWTAAIFVLVLPLTILSADGLAAPHYARWLGRAAGLATFPAGIAIARGVFGTERPWRPLLAALGAASTVAVLLFALVGLVVPGLGDARTLSQLANEMHAMNASWETRNDAAWRFYDTLLVPVHALLFAAIGLQVGVWATHALPLALRRLLYWTVALGLMITGYMVSDGTYEGVVLHAAGDVGFTAFYTLLIPASLCAGLALPTLALLRGATTSGGTG